MTAAARVFDTKDLRRIILEYVYPRWTTRGMTFEVVRGTRATPLAGRQFQICDIRVDDEFGTVVLSKARFRQCWWHRGGSGLHATTTYFYPDDGDGLRVVGNTAAGQRTLTFS